MVTRRAHAVGSSQTLRPMRRTARAPVAAAPPPSTSKSKNNAAAAAAIAADTQAMNDFFEELDQSVSASCQMMELNAGSVADAIKNAFTIEMTKIPTKIRNMDAQEFVNQYGGDLNVFVEHDRRAAVAKTYSEEAAKQQNFLATARATAVAGGGGGGRMRSRLQDNGGTGTVRRGAMVRAATSHNGAYVPATPAMDPNLPQTPAQLGGTVRRPRRGETLMSARGSPVVTDGGADEYGEGAGGGRASSMLSTQQFNSVDNLRSMFDDKKSALQDAENLTDEDKHLAFKELTSLSEQVASLMSQIYK